MKLDIDTKSIMETYLSEYSKQVSDLAGLEIDISLERFKELELESLNSKYKGRKRNSKAIQEEQIAKEMFHKIKELCPVLSGKLRDSITLDLNYHGHPAIYTTLDYAVDVHENEWALHKTGMAGFIIKGALQINQLYNMPVKLSIRIERGFVGVMINSKYGFELQRARQLREKEAKKEKITRKMNSLIKQMSGGGGEK